MRRLYFATLNTLRGFRYAVRQEAALRQELFVLATAFGVGPFLAPGHAWFVAMIGALLVVMALEFLNTAIEKLADHVHPGWDARIGLIKDFGSAAVFCAISMAALVWLVAAGLRLGWLAHV